MSKNSCSLRTSRGADTTVLSPSPIARYRNIGLSVPETMNYLRRDFWGSSDISFTIRQEWA